MCGIFGYVGERNDAAQLIVRGLKLLEYRGYDSWGVAVGAGMRIAVERHVGRIGTADTSLPDSQIGLGHTRWATQGGITTENAHPQLDCGAQLALVHNGIVANEDELRVALARAGHCIRSQTDTELIAHLIEDLLEQTPEGPERLLRATIAAFGKLRGLNAIVVLDLRSGELAAAKNGSPLVLGFDATGHFIASDPAALIEHTRQVAFVNDGEALLLHRGAARLFDMASGEELQLESTTLEWQPEPDTRGDHPDFMSKETSEQPELLRTLAERTRGGVLELAGRIEQADEVFMIGCGSALHAAIAAQHLFAKVARRRVTAASASEFQCLLPFVGKRSLVVALSQSGETMDVLDAVKKARAQGAQIAAVTNVRGSTLWRHADLRIGLGAGPERCVLATKSLTAKLALVVLAAYAAKGELETAEALLQRAAADVADMLQGERRGHIHAIARELAAKEHLYVLGRGPSYALALETALKIKEVSYLHAEGFASGDLKHGVIALIEPGTPCIALVSEDDTKEDVLAGALQVKARGATVIGIAPKAHPAFDYHIPVADLDLATLVVSAVPAQLLGYDLACLRGHDPDMPRNLAKSVTVK
ncbi:MAG TPA: glutamine--fructose-6-phosphate transaminase (isomerizing) [Polyangiales bacterium]|nr:glutamine--fructose-6-phosphate transaminase (isomerizing) [Polyangiales bacterium]